MSETISRPDKATHFLRRVARLWSGVVIVLGVMIFIGEIIETRTIELPPYTWWEYLIPFTLFLSVISLAYAWKDECIGGAAAFGFAVLNLILYIFTGRTKVGTVALILSPVAIPGILFLVCWWRSRKGR